MRKAAIHYTIVSQSGRRRRVLPLKKQEVSARDAFNLIMADYKRLRQRNPSEEMIIDEIKTIVPHAPSSGIGPPQLGEYLLWYLPKETCEAIIGDLEEEYRTLYDRFGKRKAVLWYWWQIGASFWPVIASKMRTLVKWGAVGWLGDILRRFIT